MRLIIDRATGSVEINGTAHICDMAQVQPEIASIRWYDDHGTITYRDGRATGIGDILRFKDVIDQWHAKRNELRTR